MRIFNKDNITLHNTDALTLLAQLPDNSVDLIATDPPYYKVKGEAWDNQWQKKAAFFAWLDGILAEYHRVLNRLDRCTCLPVRIWPPKLNWRWLNVSTC